MTKTIHKRIARDYTYKDGSKKQGIYVNLYVPDSQDQTWLTKCQADYTVVDVDGVEEAIELIKKILNEKH